MGIMEDAKQAKSKNGKGKPSPQTRRAKITTFHPTERERSDLANGIYGPLEAIETLEKALSEWASISIGFKPENEAYFVILRDNRVPWNEAPALSYWNKDLARAITGLGYALGNRYEGFPDGAYQQDLFSEDW